MILGEPLPLGGDERLIAWNDREPQVEDRMIFDASRVKISIHGIPTACLLAAKASRRRPWQYALIKFRFSMNIYSAFIADLDPARSYRHLSLSPFADDHVAFSHAIMAAYSAVEDLGLELRASRERPSRINGQWNPVVKEDLEDRLHAAGISLTKPILWTIRGSSTSIQRLRKLPTSGRARWAVGPRVRDAHVSIVDAIAYADWLRDRIASHAAKRLTPSLSPYDVVNVQHVARRLIMEVHGLWLRWWESTDRHPKRRSQSRDGH